MSSLTQQTVSCVSFVLWESLSEHRSATFRLFSCGLILNHIPMLDQNAIFDANDVRRNPVHGLSEARKSPVHDNEVSLSNDHSRFVLQRWWDALDKIEQAFSAMLNMGAVLNVVS